LARSRDRVPPPVMILPLLARQFDGAKMNGKLSSQPSS
jgi:hypothetical protein